MPTAYIEEFDAAYRVNGDVIPTVPGTLMAKQKVAIAGTSAQSSALAAGTRIVHLCADTDCLFLVGANPTADANSRYLPAKVPRLISVAGGEKIAVISIS
jgi:hypothetical protein